MLSKKYYKDIASILATHKANRKLIFAFEDYFHSDNSNFDSYRFEEYIKQVKQELKKNEKSIGDI